MTAVIIKSGKFEYRNTHGECQVKTETEVGVMLHKPRNVKNCHLSLEAEYTSQGLLRCARYYQKLGDRHKTDSS